MPLLRIYRRLALQNNSFVILFQEIHPNRVRVFIYPRCGQHYLRFCFVVQIRAYNQRRRGSFNDHSVAGETQFVTIAFFVSGCDHLITISHINEYRTNLNDAVFSTLFQFFRSFSTQYLSFVRTPSELAIPY